MHRTTARFRKLFGSLAPEVQQRARDSFQLLRGNDYVWVWIGTHDEYNRLIGRN
jgi:hypothetical protein